jgi:hypothetical protein
VLPAASIEAAGQPFEQDFYPGRTPACHQAERQRMQDGSDSNAAKSDPQRSQIQTECQEIDDAACGKSSQHADGR